MTMKKYLPNFLNGEQSPRRDSQLRQGSDGQAGQAMMVATILFLVVSITIIFGLAGPILKQQKMTSQTLLSRQSYFLAEAGVENVVYKLKTGKPVAPTETLSLGESSATITTTDVLGGKQIVANADVKESARKVRVDLVTGSGASFHYGVQVGNGGVRMENSSSVFGSIYSSGNVFGGGSGAISGDVFAASTSLISDAPDIGGNAQAHAIDHTRIAQNASSTTSMVSATISGSAYADTITNSNITKDAYYNTSISGTIVGGSIFSGVSPPTDLPVLSFPITDDQISGWEAAAVAGGTYISPCPYVISGGTVSLGPKKINCDLTISGGVTTINGPVWVVGNIEFKNTADIKLASGYQSTSEVIIADNPADRLTSSKIALSNSSEVYGSSGGYLILVSRNNSSENGGNERAINIQNSASSSVLYAPHGKVQISNSTHLKEVVAYLLHLTNSASVSYETGLSSLLFSSGPSGGYVIKSWDEIQ